MTTRWPELPAWPACVRVGFTERSIPLASGARGDFNLAAHVGDDPRHVAENRRRLQGELPEGCRFVWLDQVHGTDVVRADPGGSDVQTADGLWTDDPRVVCGVLTADCLPVVLCARDGSRVAALHAGWRGLVGGVIEAGLRAMAVEAGDVLAWLGPAIGPAAFEVGPEVREAFLRAANATHQLETVTCFTASERRPGHYYGDLRALAELRLRAAGVREISAENACTYSDPERFFSYRRDASTGRMATFVVRL